MGLRSLDFGRRDRLLTASGLRGGGRFLHQGLHCLDKGVSSGLAEVRSSTSCISQRLQSLASEWSHVFSPRYRSTRRRRRTGLDIIPGRFALLAVATWPLFAYLED
jgi:hypothetical protein